MELYCKNCWNFGRCSAVGRTVAFAVNHGVCRDFDEVKPLTNAQKIRAMSDEELVGILGMVANGNIFDLFCDNPKRTVECDARCFNCIREWLKQSVEEETNDTT